MKNVYVINISLNFQIYHILKQFNTSIDFVLFASSHFRARFRFVSTILDIEPALFVSDIFLYRYLLWQKDVTLQTVQTEIELTKQI